MILDGYHFIYGSFDSETYDLVFGHADTSIFTGLAGSLSSSAIFNKKGKLFNFVGYDYSNSAISFDAEVVTCGGDEISSSNRRVIEKALFNRPEYLALSVPDSGSSLYFRCRLVNPSKIEHDGGIIGYGFTVECDSNLMWEDTTTQTFTSSSFTVSVDSDLTDYIYPKVTIVGASGTLSIVNSTDDSTRATTFTGLPSGSTITMRGDYSYVSGSYYQYFSGQNFIRLIDGSNTFSVSGTFTSITFEWNNRRYIL